MRASAKLNVFLGVLNLSEEFMPAHLRLPEQLPAPPPMNLLFPVSVTFGTVLSLILLQRAVAAGVSAVRRWPG